jgi:hypothetical protein
MRVGKDDEQLAQGDRDCTSAEAGGEYGLQMKSVGRRREVEVERALTGELRIRNSRRDRCYGGKKGKMNWKWRA